jgi:hypothetical protein
MLGLVVLSSLYVSPWRQAIYLFADPKVGAVREKLLEFQIRIRDQESRIVVSSRDSLPGLEASQAKLWQEYKGWRNRLGQMANAHKSKSPTDFLAWSTSLVVWVLPGALLFFFGGGLLALYAVMRQQEKYPVLAPRPRRTPAPSEPSQPLDQFQEAVRRIADIQSRSPIRQKARAEAPKPTALPNSAEENLETPGEITRQVASQPSRSASTLVASPWAVQPEEATPVAPPRPRALEPKSTEERVARPANWQDAEAQLPAGMSLHPPRHLTPEDTTYMDVLSGWEDLAQTAQSDMPPPPDGPQPGALSPSAFLRESPETGGNPLTMEDEDQGELAAFHGNDAGGEMDNPYSVADLGPSEPVYGRMPATTEFEKIEKQKAEVVKLARKGLTTSEISRRLKLSEDQVDLIVRMRRERG